MDEDLDFEDNNVNESGNWSPDYLNELDTSGMAFPNTLWHVKSTKEMLVKSTIMLMIALPGLYMNFVILLVLFKNKWLWSPSNFLIGNMALIDFLTLLMCPWFMLVRDFYQNYVLKNFGCRFEGFLQGGITLVKEERLDLVESTVFLGITLDAKLQWGPHITKLSNRLSSAAYAVKKIRSLTDVPILLASLLLGNVAAVVLVTYDRLAAAVLPTEARVTKSIAPKLIACSWGVALIFSLPWIISREYVERQWLDHLETYCVEDPDVLVVYWHFILLLLVWIPLAIMMVTYGGILWCLERSARKLSSRGGGQLVSRAKARTMRVAAGVLLADSICRIPFSVLIYLRGRSSLEINWVDGSYSILWFSSNALMYFNCTINPLIYGFTNNRLLKAMDRTPGIACCKFGTWCCVCASNSKKELHLQQDKNTEKIFIIESTPRPKKKITRIIKNILHINADAIDLSIQRLDEVTTKPTKVTPLKPELNLIDKEFKNESEKENNCEENCEQENL